MGVSPREFEPRRYQIYFSHFIFFLHLWVHCVYFLLYINQIRLRYDLHIFPAFNQKTTARLENLSQRISVVKNVHYHHYSHR